VLRYLGEEVGWCTRLVCSLSLEYGQWLLTIYLFILLFRKILIFSGEPVLRIESSRDLLRAPSHLVVPVFFGDSLVDLAVLVQILYLCIGWSVRILRFGEEILGVDALIHRWHSADASVRIFLCCCIFLQIWCLDVINRHVIPLNVVEDLLDRLHHCVAIIRDEPIIICSLNVQGELRLALAWLDCLC